MARRSGLALSYLNVYLKDLIRKGYVSVRDMPGRRLWYNLTPKGIAEKARMTLEYMKWSLGRYQSIREKVREVCDALKRENKRQIVIFGISDAAEIFYLATMEAGLEVVTVIDARKAGQKWLNFGVKKSEWLKQERDYDVIVIGDIDNCYGLARELSVLSIPDSRFMLCTGQKIRAITVVQVVE